MDEHHRISRRNFASMIERTPHRSRSLRIRQGVVSGTNPRSQIYYILLDYGIG